MCTDVVGQVGRCIRLGTVARLADELVGISIGEMTNDESIRCDPVAVAAETRVFVAVRENSTGRALLLNSKGPILSAGDRARCTDGSRGEGRGRRRHVARPAAGAVAPVRPSG